MLRQKNQRYFEAGMGHRMENFDMDYVISRRQKLSEPGAHYSFEDWANDPCKALMCQDMIPRNNINYSRYKIMSSRYENDESVTKYINDDENDPHLLNILCYAKDSLEENKYNSSLSTTNGLFCDLLIVTDPWDGRCLNEIITRCNPHALIFCLEKWEDLDASFDIIDWCALSDSYREQKKFFSTNTYH